MRQRYLPGELVVWDPKTQRDIPVSRWEESNKKCIWCEKPIYLDSDHILGDTIKEGLHFHCVFEMAKILKQMKK